MYVYILYTYILQCLRTLEISSSDMAGEESKAKREYRFYILRPGDGRYVFKCTSPQQRDEWTISLNKVITVSVCIIFPELVF